MTAGTESIPGFDPNEILKIEKAWNQSLDLLPAEQKNRYISYLENHGLRKQQLNRPYLYHLYHLFLYSGAIQGAIYYRRRCVFLFGIESGDQPDGFQRFRVNAQEIEIDVMIPLLSAEESKELIRKKMMPLVTRYIPADSGYNPRNWFDYAGSVEKLIAKRIKKFSRPGRKAALTHFLFQDLTTYFRYSGEFWTREVLSEIRRSIQKHAHEQDLLMTVTPHSYLLLSFEYNKEEIENKFIDLYVEVKGLILDYEMFTQEFDCQNYETAALLKSVYL